MMSSHDPNPIFFNNKKIKTGRPEYLLTPHPLHPITSHFCITPPPPPHSPPPTPPHPLPPSKWTPCVYHLLCLYVQQHPPPEM